MSFATAAALIPTAVALISLRDDVPSTRRCTFVVPWLGLAALFLISVDASSTSSNGLAHFADIPRYAFNFLGAGIARFATDLAPWLALGGLFVGAWAYADVRARRECLPWSGLCVFAIGASVLVAVGRTAAFGATHAFVTRYVSFSSMSGSGRPVSSACVSLIEASALR